MKLLQDTKGFSALEVGLIVIVMGILGGSGYYVYDKNKTNTPTPSVQQEDTKDKQSGTQQQLETYEGEQVTSLTGKFSLRIPNGWNINASTIGDTLWQYDVKSLVYSQKVSPQIVKVDGDGGVGGWVPGINVYADATEPEWQGTPIAYTLDDGTSGKCLVKEYTRQEVLDSGNSNNDSGFTSRNCYFEKDSKAVYIRYSYFNNDPLDEKLMNQVVKTLKLQ